MKKVYYVSIPYHDDGEYEIYIMDDVADNYKLEDNEYDTLEEAKEYIVKQYEIIRDWYQRRMINIKVSNNIVN